jgi:hypothetical protein
MKRLLEALVNRSISTTDAEHMSLVDHVRAEERAEPTCEVKRLLVARSVVQEELAARDVWRWQRSWRQVFARELHDRTGKWILHGYDWHVFSYAYGVCLSGDRARREYGGVGTCEFVVMSGSASEDFGYRCVGVPPDLGVGVDAIVVEKSLSWTMLFTHEADHGPYYARSEEQGPP